jgi:hypothetical protein
MRITSHFGVILAALVPPAAMRFYELFCEAHGDTRHSPSDGQQHLQVLVCAFKGRQLFEATLAATVF